MGDGVTHDDPIADKRMAGLLLDDGRYRLVQMNVQLGPADRQGILFIALPVLDPPPVDATPIKDAVDWSNQFPKVVQDAPPAALTALLLGFSLPLATARAFQVGTVVPLPGCNVSSVRLMAADGKEIAQTKLGQSGGMRAVRSKQAAPMPDLHDLTAPMGADTLTVEALSDCAFDFDAPDVPEADFAVAPEEDAIV